MSSSLMPRYGVLLACFGDVRKLILVILGMILLQIPLLLRSEQDKNVFLQPEQGRITTNASPIISTEQQHHPYLYSNRDVRPFLQIPKNPQRPRNVYWCGWPSLYTDFSYNMMDLLFPDVPIRTYLTEEWFQNSSSDDVLLYSCGHTCTIPHSDIPFVFPGKVVTFNPESTMCFEELMNNASFYANNRITNFMAIDEYHLQEQVQERRQWQQRQQQQQRQGREEVVVEPLVVLNQKSLNAYFGATVLSVYPDEVQQSIWNASNRRYNTKEKFLIYAASHCRSHREEAFVRLSRLGKNREPAEFGGRCRGGKVPYGQTNATTGMYYSQDLELETFIDTYYQQTNNNENRQPLSFHSLPRPLPLPNIIRSQSSDNKNRGKNNGKKWYGNQAFFQRYRFVLCMENRNFTGYVTEKIINAFVSGSIPIYYGPSTTEVYDIFNHKAFIYMDIHNPVPALEQVYHLERNETAYDEMLNQPILAHGETTIEKYFSFSDNVGSGQLKWQLRTLLGYV